MARFGLALLALAGVVLFAGAAQAKAPPGGVDVCGPSACAHLDFADAEQFWIATGTGGSPASTLPGRFYLLRWSWSPGEVDTAYLLFDAPAIRWNSGPGHAAGWGGVDSTMIDLVRRAAGDVAPYPAPVLTRVTVGGREVASPQTYFRLLGGKPTWVPIDGRWWRVRFESATASPWTDGSAIVLLSRNHPLVVIDGRYFRLPRTVVRQARLGLALTG
jgi:hypothetical protein